MVRVFMDPIHLDRARMTKTPLLLPPMVNDELNTLGVLKRRGVGGGEEQFYIDS